MTVIKNHIVKIFALALILRVFLVVWLSLAPAAYRPGMAIFAADALLYDEIAQNLLRGEGYHYKNDYVMTARTPPLFPLMVAGVYALTGRSVLAVGLANALLGALTAVALYFLVLHAFPQKGSPEKKDNLAASEFKHRTAFVAGCIFAIYPLEIFNTPYVLKENLSIFLTVAFALAWAMMLRPSPRRITWAVACGVLLGLSILSRLHHVGLLALFLVVTTGLIWLQHRAGKKQHAYAHSNSHLALPLEGAPAEMLSRKQTRLSAVSACVALCACFLTLLPWLVRQYNVLGQFTLTSHGPAFRFFQANSAFNEPETDGYFEARGSTNQRVQMNKRLHDAAGNDVRHREKLFMRESLRQITSHPVHVLKLVGAKFICMWRPVWAGSSLRTWLLLGIPYILMMLLALPGLVAARRLLSVADPQAIVLYAVVAFYFVAHLVWYGMIRERQYVEPFLIGFAAYAFCRWLQPQKNPLRKSEPLAVHA